MPSANQVRFVGLSKGAANIWTADQTFNDDVKLTLGTGGDADFYHDGTDVILLPRVVGAGDFLIQTANAGETIIVTSENTNNSAAAGHAVLEAKVGGTTSTGDPQLRLTIPSGTSWYAGVDNSNNDKFYIGTGTAVGSASRIIMDSRTSGATAITAIILQQPTLTMSDSASAEPIAVRVPDPSVTLAGTTQITALIDAIRFGRLTLTQSGGAVTVNKATTLSVQAPYINTSITGTAISAIRVLETDASHAGTVSASHGIYIDDKTLASADFGLTVEGADTACVWLSNAADNTDAANGIAFGSSRDTVLYRGAANQLKTDDAIAVGSQVISDSSGNLASANGADHGPADATSFTFVNGICTAIS
jgi:hypothetical protein